MKKYLFGIFAFALAIGFSAFTKPVKKDSHNPALMTFTKWYYATANGKVGALFYSGAAVDRDHVPSNPCDDEALPVCLVGSNTTLTANTDIPEPIGEGDPASDDDADNYILDHD